MIIQPYTFLILNTCATYNHHRLVDVLLREIKMIIIVKVNC